MAREFIIQRYASVNWPMLLGRRPFVSTGPSFRSWVVPGSLERTGRWELLSTVLDSIRAALPVGRLRTSDLLALAELLLADGIVQALWLDGRPLCEDAEGVELAEVVSEALGGSSVETMTGFDTATELTWALGTLPSPSDLRSYVSEDALVLEPRTVG